MTKTGTISEVAWCTVTSMGYLEDGILGGGIGDLGILSNIYCFCYV